jgi:hypothetical protein
MNAHRRRKDGEQDEHGIFDLALPIPHVAETTHALSRRIAFSQHCLPRGFVQKLHLVIVAVDRLAVVGKTTL